MKIKFGHFINIFPLEKLLPDLDECDINAIVSNCDYTIEADQIAESHNMHCCKVNIADAIVFYRMGYEAAQERINMILKPERG